MGFKLGRYKNQNPFWLVFGDKEIEEQALAWARGSKGSQKLTLEELYKI